MCISQINHFLPFSFVQLSIINLINRNGIEGKVLIIKRFDLQLNFRGYI